MLLAASPLEICREGNDAARALLFESLLSIESSPEWSETSESDCEGNSSEELLEASNKLVGPLLYKLAVLEAEGRRGGVFVASFDLNDPRQGTKLEVCFELKKQYNLHCE